MVSSERLLRMMAETVPPAAWPKDGDRIVVAVSGGPDSTALAFLLQALNLKESRGWQLHLVHLNHGLRGADSDADAQFVAELARLQKWQVTIEKRVADNRKTPCEQDHGSDGPKTARTEDLSSPSKATGSEFTLEEAARNQRYALFGHVLHETGASVVATAHHADDNVETILHRLIRGTGFQGLSGIPATRALCPSRAHRVIRPLLRIRREEITAYLKERNIESCHDQTNETAEFTRNRIRNELLPELQGRYNPGVRDALLRLAEQAAWVNEFLHQEVQRKYAAVAITGERTGNDPTTATLDTRALLHEPVIVRTGLVRRAMATIGVGQKKITFEHILSIVELAEKNASGKRLELPGLSVSYDRKRLTLKKT